MTVQVDVEAAVEGLNEVIFGIADQFTPTPVSVAYVAALRFKPGAFIEMLRVTNGRNPEGVERLLNRAIDRDDALQQGYDAVSAANQDRSLDRLLV